VLISGGKFDSQIPQKKTIELKGVLEKAGAAVKMNWEESDHALVRDDIVKARLWLSTS